MFSVFHRVAVGEDTHTNRAFDMTQRVNRRLIWDFGDVSDHVSQLTFSAEGLC